MLQFSADACLVMERLYRTPTMSHTRYAGFVLLLLLGAGSSRAAETPLSRFTFTEPHMGTRFKIVVYAADEATANRAARAAFARIATLDTVMSDYRATSELMRL